MAEPIDRSRLRVATYNASLYDRAAGGLVARLQAGDADAGNIAAVLQRVRPDVVLLNEFDHDPAQRAADLFQRDYLEVARAGGGDPLHYPYRYLAPANTGVPSGVAFDPAAGPGDRRAVVPAADLGAVAAVVQVALGRTGRDPVRHRAPARRAPDPAGVRRPREPQRPAQFR